MRLFRARARGFTLIELMLVVAIIGLLATIAIPKFAGLIIKSKEAAVKGHLGSLRSALSIYYSDNEGTFPYMMAELKATLVPKYMNAISFIKIPTIPESTHPYGDLTMPVMVADGEWSTWLSRSWAYTAPGNQIFVNCTHLDSTGRVWSTW